MSLILAVEPDRTQAARVAEVLRGGLDAELVIAASSAQALDALGDRVPDLLLTSPLLSRQDERALAARLRELGAAAAHVQSLTIPILAAAPKAASRRRGVLSALRRTRASASTPDGCEPGVFADQVALYLQRAAAERIVPAEPVAAPEPAPEPIAALAPEPIAAIAPEPEPIAAIAPEPEPEPIPIVEPIPVIEPEPMVAIAPEPVFAESCSADLVRSASGEPDKARPTDEPEEPAPEPIAALAPEPIAAIAPEPEPIAAIAPEPEPEPIPIVEPIPVIEPEPIVAIAPEPAVVVELQPEPVTQTSLRWLTSMLSLLPRRQQPEVAAVVALPDDDEPVLPEDDAVWVVVPLEELAPVHFPRLAEPEDVPEPDEVWVLPPITDDEPALIVNSEPEPPAKKAELPAPSRPAPAPPAPAPPPAPPAEKKAVEPRKKATRARARPVQDEWGLFDPAQCGFAALVDKLDEVTDTVERREETTVRVLSY